MPKRILRGIVSSDKADKTITVKVERRFADPLLGKTLRRFKKYHAHDPFNRFHIGDEVMIQETRPISKHKAWQVISKPKSASKKSEGQGT